jgi:hypothetical protein
VTGVAERLIRVLEEGHGGGYQKHLRSFRWEVSVVDQPIMNGVGEEGGLGEGPGAGLISECWGRTRGRPCQQRC